MYASQRGPGLRAGYFPSGARSQPPPRSPGTSPTSPSVRYKIVKKVGSKTRRTADAASATSSSVSSTPSRVAASAPSSLLSSPAMSRKPATLPTYSSTRSTTTATLSSSSTINGSSRRSSSRGVVSSSSRRKSAKIRGGTATDVSSTQRSGTDLMSPKSSSKSLKKSRSGKRSSARKAASAGSSSSSSTTSRTGISGVGGKDPSEAGAKTTRGFRGVSKYEARVRIWVSTWNMAAKSHFTTHVDSASGTVRVDRSEVESKIRPILPTDYDLYVVGVQEGIDENFWDCVSAYLRRFNVERLELDPKRDRVHGRGDGSFLSTKFTGIAVYVRRSMREVIKHLSTGAVSAGMMEGSKGAAAVVLKIYSTTICFLSAHMSSNTPLNKREHFKTIVKGAGSKIGIAPFGLLEQFHHVVWFGDLNYRLLDYGKVEQVLDLMARGQLSRLWEMDTLREEMTSVLGAFNGFNEPVPRLDFYPTYKKIPDRDFDFDECPLILRGIHTAGAGATAAVAAAAAIPDATPVHLSPKEVARRIKRLAKVYKIKYKIPFYKGGSTEDRCPSFTDRILYHSLGSCMGQLQCERDEPVMEYHTPRMRYSEFGCNKYGAIVHNLSGSDHSAVYSGFTLQSPILTQRPPFELDFHGRPKVYCIHISSIEVVRVQLVTPKVGTGVVSPAASPPPSPLSTSSTGVVSPRDFTSGSSHTRQRSLTTMPQSGSVKDSSDRAVPGLQYLLESASNKRGFLGDSGSISDTDSRAGASSSSSASVSSSTLRVKSTDSRHLRRPLPPRLERKHRSFPMKATFLFPAPFEAVNRDYDPFDSTSTIPGISSSSSSGLHARKASMTGVTRQASDSSVSDATRRGARVHTVAGNSTITIVTRQDLESYHRCLHDMEQLSHRRLSKHAIPVESSDIGIRNIGRATTTMIAAAVRSGGTVGSSSMFDGLARAKVAGSAALRTKPPKIPMANEFDSTTSTDRRRLRKILRMADTTTPVGSGDGIIETMDPEKAFSPRREVTVTDGISGAASSGDSLSSATTTNGANLVSSAPEEDDFVELLDDDGGNDDDDGIGDTPLMSAFLSDAEAPKSIAEATLRNRLTPLKDHASVDEVFVIDVGGSSSSKTDMVTVSHTGDGSKLGVPPDLTSSTMDQSPRAKRRLGKRSKSVAPMKRSRSPAERSRRRRERTLQRSKNLRMRMLGVPRTKIRKPRSSPKTRRKLESGDDGGGYKQTASWDMLRGITDPSGALSAFPPVTPTMPMVGDPLTKTKSEKRRDSAPCLLVADLDMIDSSSDDDGDEEDWDGFYRVSDETRSLSEKEIHPSSSAVPDFAADTSGKTKVTSATPPVRSSAQSSSVVRPPRKSPRIAAVKVPKTPPPPVPGIDVPSSVPSAAAASASASASASQSQSQSSLSSTTIPSPAQSITSPSDVPDPMVSPLLGEKQLSLRRASSDPLTSAMSPIVTESSPIGTATRRSVGQSDDSSRYSVVTVSSAGSESRGIEKFPIGRGMSRMADDPLSAGIEGTAASSSSSSSTSVSSAFLKDDSQADLSGLLSPPPTMRSKSSKSSLDSGARDGSIPSIIRHRSSSFTHGDENAISDEEDVDLKKAALLHQSLKNHYTKLTLYCHGCDTRPTHGFMHLVVRVKSESAENGQCVFAFKWDDFGRDVGGTKEAPLTVQGIPYMDKLYGTTVRCSIEYRLSLEDPSTVE